MSRTLNQLIATAVLGGEEVEEQAPHSAESQVEPVTSDPDLLVGAEKLASALEFMGRRGIDNLLSKKAMAHPENNMGQMHAEHVQKQVGPHAGASPMKPPGFGPIPNNAGQRPGMPSPATGVDTSSHGGGTHHPALASNEAAINYTKKEKSKKVAPALGAVLDNTAYNDGKLKENLSHTSGDKNIKKAHDLAAVKAELERRSQGVS